ncbi:MAG: hypothetical protein INH41_07755 [Myxococcaceae bacterium]|jgi:hypothetical protein|nr:hypothetical protein [Myxococcaceae bacterium]
MKYRVRNQDGELEFESFGQLEQAWLMGLVEPSDEVLQEGHAKWRRADSYAVLATARRHGDDVWNGSWFLFVLIGVALATVALVLFKQAAAEKSDLKWGLGFLVAIVDVVLMTRVTVNAQRRRDPHRRSKR